jgi:pimeloyl-ACP methyl ester carboxylesterase
LPAYDLSPEQEPNGTWVVFGGFDSYVEEWFPMLAAAVAAGRRLIVFDGPGQGGALIDNDIKMIVEWERPVKAILDHFDLRDVTLVGASMGGALAIRAAAFESRVSRVVSFDILVNLLEVFMSNVSESRAQKLTKIMPRVPARLMNAYMGALIRRKPLFEWGIDHGMNVTGAESPAGFLRSANRFDTTDISSRVTCDALLLAGATDHAIPFSMLARQTALLTNARSVTTRRFTEAEHASNHCQIGNIGIMISTVLSWEAGLDAVRRTT